MRLFQTHSPLIGNEYETIININIFKFRDIFNALNYILEHWNPHLS